MQSWIDFCLKCPLDGHMAWLEWRGGGLTGYDGAPVLLRGGAVIQQNKCPETKVQRAHSRGRAASWLGRCYFSPGQSHQRHVIFLDLQVRAWHRRAPSRFVSGTQRSAVCTEVHLNITF